MEPIAPLVLAAMLLTLPSSAASGTTRSPSVGRRVHALKPEPGAAAALVAEAFFRSRTIRSMIARLNSSDVVVHVRADLSRQTGTGDLHFLVAAGGVRRVLVTIDFANREDDRIAWFAHELQHAIEVSQAPEVRDADAFARLYDRIGWKTDMEGQTFETDAAIDVRTRVLDELAPAAFALRTGTHAARFDR